MIVTAIVPLPKKNRFKIFLDQEFAFVLYKGELRSYQVKEGEELSSENYRQIREEVLPKRAKLRCMNLLQSKDYTRCQLKEKLRDGFYPEEVMEEALDYVASYHYIDDLRYALQYIHYHNESKSRKSIDITLLQRGVAKDVLQQAWAEWAEQGNAQDEETQIRKLLEKRHFQPETADKALVQKTYGFLLRKGFSMEIIKKVVKNYQEDDFYLT